MGRSVPRARPGTRTSGWISCSTWEVTYQANVDGTLDHGAAPWPVVVFVQGGLVAAGCYRWIVDDLATRGYVVALSAHMADLAFFESDNAVLALRAVQHVAAGAGTLAGAVAADVAHRRAAGPAMTHPAVR